MREMPTIDLPADLMAWLHGLDQKELPAVDRRRRHVDRLLRNAVRCYANAGRDEDLRDAGRIRRVVGGGQRRHAAHQLPPHAHVRYRVLPRVGDADSASVSGPDSSSGSPASS